MWSQIAEYYTSTITIQIDIRTFHVWEPVCTPVHVQNITSGKWKLREKDTDQQNIEACRGYSEVIPNLLLGRFHRAFPQARGQAGELMARLQEARTSREWKPTDLIPLPLSELLRLLRHWKDQVSNFIKDFVFRFLNRAFSVKLPFYQVSMAKLHLCLGFRCVKVKK